MSVAGDRARARSADRHRRCDAAAIRRCGSRRCAVDPRRAPPGGATGSSRSSPTRRSVTPLSYLLRDERRACRRRRRCARVEQYLILTIDHGFNASTFTARVVASTGADLADAVCAALGALAGPLHGGAPSRALDALDAIGSPDRAAAGYGPRWPPVGGSWASATPSIAALDPRSALLRGDGAKDRVANSWSGPIAVEAEILVTLAELKPDRPLPSNVEFFAGVVMATAGLPRAHVHADVRREPHGRLDEPRRRAGGRRQADPPHRPLHRPHPQLPALARRCRCTGARAGQRHHTDPT